MKTSWWKLKMHRRLFSAIFVAIGLLVIDGCTKHEISGKQPVSKFGQVSFSFSRSNTPPGGRVQEITPAFVSYTLKKPDGSTVSDKVELYQFNGYSVTHPQQLEIGHYEVQQFLLLSADNGVLAAAPLVGSELATLVEHPLPLPFDVTENATTSLVPEVLLIENHSPGAFGYLVFGFEVVNLLSFDTNVTIADNNPHGAIDYTLEIIAKDAPLGNIKWTKTIQMTGSGNIQLPDKYAHYTFRAIKAGYIPHVQHFLKAELLGNTTLNFEFIPESLQGFSVSENANGIVKFYFTNDDYRCKFYARVDIAEGYSLKLMRADKVAKTKGGLPLSLLYAAESSEYKNRVSIFNNTPFNASQDFCSMIHIPNGNTLNDVNITSVITVKYEIIGSTSTPQFVTNFRLWKGINNM